jgi:hypothetical protein
VPVYRIGTPDGRTIKIQAPDAATATKGAAEWVSANPAAGSREAAYAQGKRTAQSGVGGMVHAGLEQLNRAVPGFSELSALGPTVAATIDDAVHGRHGPRDGFAADWDQVRARQAGEVDQNRADHPLASGLEQGSGYALQALPALATGGATAAPQIARAGFMAGAGRVAATAGRNAITGAALGGLNAAAQPGTIAQRGDAATAAIAPGAAAGVALPIAAAGAARVARPVIKAFAPTVGRAMGAVRGVVGDLAADTSGSVPPTPPRSVTSLTTPPATAEAAATPQGPSTAGSPPGAPPPPPAAPPAAAPPAGTGGLSPVEASAIKKFVKVARPDINAITGRAAAYNDAGIAPTLVDTTGRRGQGIVQALASRPTPAQDAVERFYEQRQIALPSRMGAQARDIVSSDPRTPEQINQDVVDARSARARMDFEPVRPQMIDVTPQMQNALVSPYGISAINDAMKRTVDPTEREALRLLYEHIRPGQDGVATGSLDGAKISIGQAQDISKALFDGAGAAPDQGKQTAMRQFGLDLRNGAKMQSPDYEEALRRFSDASTLAEAPAIGRAGISRPADTFDGDLERLRGVPSPVDSTGAPILDANGAAFDPVSLAKPGFRRAIEAAAGEGGPGTAMSTAWKLADAPEQQQRNLALLGEPDALRLQNAMRMERAAVTNAYRTSPGTGSLTALRTGNAAATTGDVMESAGAAAAAAHGNAMPAGALALKTYLKHSNAFSDEEAEALAHLAIDPTRHDAAVAAIASRIGDQAAENLRPMMQQAAAGAGAAAGGASDGNAFQPASPPNPGP